MRTGVTVLLALCLAVSGATAQQPGRTCSIAEAPAPGADAARVYRDCDVDQPARLERDQRASYQAPGSNANELSPTCVVAVLMFVVDTTGVPDTLTATVVETNDMQFTSALVRTLPRWRYRPARLGGAAVRQVVLERRTLELVPARVPFTVTRTGQPEPTPPPREPCR